MCSTCNPSYFKKIALDVNGRTVERLEQSLGYGSLAIRCDTNGRNWYLTVTNESKSQFKLYGCPTCRRMLD